METNQNENNQLKKNTKKVVALLFSFFAVCAIALACIGVWKSGNQENKEVISVVESDKTEYMASSADELRELLLAKKEFTITLKKDIYVDEPLMVAGTKTLKGNHSIIMELYVKPYQNILQVTDNARLILDGATVDGNGVASCIKVDPTGELTTLSGKLEYAFPYAIDAAGSVVIEDITIENSLCSGLYLVAGAKAEITGGKFLDSTHAALYVGKDAEASLTDDAVLQGSANTLIQNAGKLTVTGGVLKDADQTLVKNTGELTVQSPSEEKLEWCNAGRYGIWSTTGSTVTKVDGLYLHDTGYTAILIVKSKGVDIKNSIIENAGKDGIYAATKSEGIVENVTIKSSGTHGINANASKLSVKNVVIEEPYQMGLLSKEDALIEFENVKIIKPRLRGIMSVGGKVSGKNIEIDSPGLFGITAAAGATEKKIQAKITLENLTLKDVESRNGINIIGGSVVSITNGTISGVKKECGAKIHGEGSKLTLKNVKISDCAVAAVLGQTGSKSTLENVTISDMTKYGVQATVDSTIVLKKVDIKDTGYGSIVSYAGKISGQDVTVTSPGTYGVFSGVKGEKTGSVTLTRLAVTGAEKKNALQVMGGSSLKVTDGTITDTKVASSAYAKDSGSKLTLKNVTIKNSVSNAVLCDFATVKAENLTIDTAKEAGIRNNGGTVSGTTVAVENAGTYGVWSRTAREIASKTSLNGLTVTDTAASNGLCVGGGSTMTVKNGTISNTLAASGVSATGVGSTMKLTNVDIVDSANDGIISGVGTKLVCSNVNVTNSGEDGINVKGNGATATLNTVAVKNCGKIGIYCQGNTVTGKNITVDTTGSYSVVSSVYTAADKQVYTGNMSVANLSVANTQKNNGLYATGGSKINVAGGSISDTKDSSSVYAKGEGSQIGLKDVTISSSAGNGILNDFGVVTVENVAVNVVTGDGIRSNGGTVTGKKVHVSGVEGNGIISRTASEVTSNVELAEVTVEDIKTTNGLYVVGGSTLTVNGGTIAKVLAANGASLTGAGSTLKMNGVDITESNKSGVLAGVGTVLDFTNVKITTSGADGITMNAEAQATLNTVTVKDSIGKGIYCQGGTVTGDNITVDTAGDYGVVSSVGTYTTEVDTEGVTEEVEKTASGDVSVKNLIVNNVQKNHGLYVAGGAKLVADGGSVSNTLAGSGVYNNRSTMNLSNMTIDTSSSDGFYIIGNASSSVLTNVNINNSGLHGVENYEGHITATGLNITGTTKHGMYITGGKSTTELKQAENEAAEVYTNSITGAKGDGIRVENSVKSATFNSVKMENIGADGMYLGSTIVTGTKIAINGTGRYGVSVARMQDTVPSKITLEQLVTANTQSNGVHILSNSKTPVSEIKVTGGTIGKTNTGNGVHNNRSKVELIDVTVENSCENGYYVIGGNSVSTLTNVKFRNWGAGYFGIFNDQGNITNSTISEMTSEVNAVQIKTNKAKNTVINNITYDKNYEGSLKTE